MAWDPAQWCGVEIGEGIKVHKSFPWGGTSQKFSLSTAPGCVMVERKTTQKVCSLPGDCFSMLQPLQGLPEKIQFLSLHLRNNKECVGKSGMLPWLGGTFHTKYSLKYWLKPWVRAARLLSQLLNCQAALTANLYKSSLEPHSSNSLCALWSSTQ